MGLCISDLQTSEAETGHKGTDKVPSTRQFEIRDNSHQRRKQCAGKR